MTMSMGSYASRVVATAVVATDGTGDFTTIQAAIDSLPAGGGVVYVKEGTYTITATIEIHKSNVALFGAGKATIVYLADGSNCDMIEIGDGVNAFTGIVVADLALDGNKANNVGAISGIYVAGQATDSKIQRCWIYDINFDGIYAQIASDKNLITENTVSDNGRVGILVVGSTEGNTVSNNTCYDNTRDGIWVGVGATLVEGNLCYGNGPDALSLGAGIHIEFSGNLVVGNFCIDNYYAEIVVWAGTEKNTITGNVCHHGRGNGIDIFGNHTVCSGNTVVGCDYRGIFCDSDYNTIAGNQCVNNGQLDPGDTYSGIELHDADYNTVTGNQCNDDRGGSAEQKYGIAETGTSDYNLILGNFCQGNVTAATITSGANTTEAYTNAVPPMASVAVLYENSGTDSSGAEATLDSFAFGAGDLSDDDWLEVDVTYENAPFSALSIKANAIALVSANTGATDGHIYFKVSQSKETAGSTIGSAVNIASLVFASGFRAAVSVALSDAWTLNLSFNPGGATVYWRWRVIVHRAV